MSGDLIRPWSSEFEDYLRDESRRTGVADSISFPRSEDEVTEVLRTAAASGTTVTVQGARTGIVGGAVPQGGHVMNLSRMDSIGDIAASSDDGFGLSVEPGALLSDIHAVASSSGLLFPPDPTETSASIGGMIACNASGAMSFAYGPTRRWVSAVRVVLPDGEVVTVERGRDRAAGRDFSLVTCGGRRISGTMPGYTTRRVKSAAGYYAADDMELVDLFVGSEGTLGVITGARLRLTPVPAAIAGLMVFLPSQAAALALVRVLRGERAPSMEPPSVRPVAIEFFNSDALDLLRRMRGESTAFSAIPALRPEYSTAIYTEFHGDSDEAVEEPVMQVVEAMSALGVSDDDTWYATDERELEPLKAFRHAVPEAVNLLIGERKKQYPLLTKLGTDMSVPDEHLEAALEMYRQGVEQAGLESVIFGHIGDNHVHVNILPRNTAEYEQGWELYTRWARQVAELGGSISAEHGIGKIKAPFLRMMYSEQEIDEMRALRRLFDPDGLLNPGDMF